jgi:hypothetical protein
MAKIEGDFLKVILGNIVLRVLKGKQLAYVSNLIQYVNCWSA